MKSFEGKLWQEDHEKYVLAAISDEDFADRLAFILTENQDGIAWQKVVQKAILDGITRGRMINGPS